jgi:hypothetical protein
VTHAATNDAKNVFAASIQTNAIRGAWNGEALTEDTSATLPTVTLLQIGKRETASSEFTGPIARVIILPGASTQDELNALSALLLN